MAEQERVNATDIEWIKGTLRRIEVQTTKTNGRVDALEKWRAKAVAYGSVLIFVLTAFSTELKAAIFG